MNIASLKSTIIGWATGVATATAAAASSPPATVYWGEPNGPRPTNPSVRLKFITGPTVLGIDEIRDKSGSGTDFLIVGVRELSLSVTGYGDLALQLVSDLQTSLSDPGTQATLEAGGVSSLSTNPPHDVSELLDTKFEQRYQFDIELLAMESVTIQPGVVEHVSGSGTVGDLAFPFAVDKTP